MADFENLDLLTSPEDFSAMMHELIRDHFPDWTPAEGNLETWIIDAHARLGNELAEVLQTMALRAFLNFGRTIVQVAQDEAVSATANSTWTVSDNLGYTIPAGTLVLIAETGDTQHAFEVVMDVDIDPGNVATDAGEVQLRAVVPGTQANDLDADPVLNEALDLPIVSIVLTADTAGGVDAESDEDYAKRLVEEMQLLTPRPILPVDFEVRARRNPGVHRAKAIDGWNTDADTLDNERWIGLVLIDEDGADVSAGIKAEVDADLQGTRETSFFVGIGTPDYTAIDVTATVHVHDTFDLAQVDADVTAAIQSYFSPANWGRLNAIDGDTSWVNQDVVRRTELFEVINRVPGVNWVENAMTIGADGGAQAQNDINLSGRVPLTQAGVIAITAEVS